MGTAVTSIMRFIFRSDKAKTSEEPMKPSLYTNCTSYYGLDGNSKVDDLIGDPDGEPFVVRVLGASWIPLSALVFAASKEDARERVLGYIRRTLAAYREADAHYRFDRNHYHYVGKIERAEKVLDLAERNMEIERFDKRYTTKASWGGDSFV